jgi:hypothetical protein
MNLTIKLISLIFKITVQTKYRMLSEPSFPLVGVITSQSISQNTIIPSVSLWLVLSPNSQNLVGVFAK